VTPARYSDGARRIAPIGVAAFAFALSFGVLARASGIGSVEAVVMSATTFAGSAQFAAASILGAAGGVASAVVAGASSAGGSGDHDLDRRGSRWVPPRSRSSRSARCF
jgi:hypothetical protein